MTPHIVDAHFLRFGLLELSPTCAEGFLEKDGAGLSTTEWLEFTSCKVEMVSSVCPWSIVGSYIVRGDPGDDNFALEAYGSRLSSVGFVKLRAIELRVYKGGLPSR